LADYLQLACASNAACRSGDLAQSVASEIDILVAVVSPIDRMPEVGDMDVSERVRIAQRSN
jgi:hypothetical protein